MQHAPCNRGHDGYCIDILASDSIDEMAFLTQDDSEIERAMTANSGSVV